VIRFCIIRDIRNTDIL